MDDVGLDERDFQARNKSGRGSFDMGGMVEPLDEINMLKPLPQGLDFEKEAGLDEPVGANTTKQDWEAWKTQVQNKLNENGPHPVWILNTDVNFAEPLAAKPLATKKLDPRAQLPTRSYNSNGYDVTALEGGEVKHGEVTQFKTGLAFDLTGYLLKIVPKSGLAVKHGIHVMAGIVDQTYVGELIVCLTKLTPGSHIFRDGDKIAQFILIRTETPEIQEVAELPETQRGDKGFGSSGV